MLIKKLLETRRADAELTTDIRAALIESLFAPVASLVVGAVACSIIGVAVALRVGNEWLMAISIGIFAAGMLRVASAVFYRKYKTSEHPTATKLWEHVYEIGAWTFSGLLGLLCWMTIMQTTDASLQMAVTATSTGYAAAISGRNAGRPFIAVGQQISYRYSQVNIVATILDLLIELPLKTILRLVRQWTQFLNQKKDELI